MFHTFTKSYRNRKGFTLIELLVVVLILAILMAVALPLYLSTVADSQLKTCRSNLQTIANAVQAARVKNVAADYSTWTSAGALTSMSIGTTNSLLPDLQLAPICPNNGTYTVVAPGASGSDGYNNSVTVPANTFGVQCSVHGMFIPGVTSK